MTIHFTGIKGVGMTALALAHQDRGHTVRGSDSKEPQITDEVLVSRGIEVFSRFTPRNITKIERSRWIPTIDKLIYTAAHHGLHNVEPKWAKSRGIPIQNYAAAVGEFFSDKKQIAVCGIGGKTTTTAMIATILEHSGLHPCWLIGTSSIPSLPAPGHWDGAGDWAVLEADEYAADPGSDKTPKFHYLTPEIIVATNIAHDHPDIYPDLKSTRSSFLAFFTRLPDTHLVISSQAETTVTANGIDLNEALHGATTIYDRNPDPKLMTKLKHALKVPGEHNRSNALAALAVAKLLRIPQDSALKALSTFTGTKRRFEHHGTINGIALYDDYAHHPLQITALIAAARAHLPEGTRLRLAFHPHTFSRTKALFANFVTALTPADEVLLIPIFASAREQPDPAVSSEALAHAISAAGGAARFFTTLHRLVEYLVSSAKPGDAIFTVGAGDIYRIHHELKTRLKEDPAQRPPRSART